MRKLILIFVNLGLLACTNEDLSEGNIQEDAIVTVRIQESISRAVESNTSGKGGTANVDIQSILLTLDAGSGQQTINAVESDGVYEFTKVRNPKKISVSINGGVPADMILNDELVKSGLKAPLYAESTNFEQTAENVYTVTLTPLHRLTRLQFSGIKHIDGDDNCIYTALTFDGLFLNNVAVKEKTMDNALKVSATVEEAGTVWTDVKKWDIPVFDEVNAEDFLTNKIGWPAPAKAGSEAQCYAYNIFPSGAGQSITELPKLTLCFSKASVKPGVASLDSEYRFVTVGKYMNGMDEITAFLPGYIYNITGLTIDDEDLGYTPDGGKDATLTATVTITPWNLVEGTVEWN